jgi:hypothetical protein
MNYRFKLTFFTLCLLSLLISAKPKEVLSYIEKTNNVTNVKEYVFYYYIKDKYVNRIEYFKDTIVLNRNVRFLFKKEIFKYDDNNRLIIKQVWLNKPIITVENNQVYFNRKAEFKCVNEEKYKYEQPINF